MKFGDKYELVKSVAAGPVETFVAKDIRRGELVLVHILECGEQKTNQPTIQWVMEAFRGIAPEPAGVVLEAGRYSGTLYAYLVTQLPEEAALLSWVERYEACAQETQEIATPLPVSTKDYDSPTADLAAGEPSPSAGTFTRAFGGFGLQADSPLGSNPSTGSAMGSEAHQLRPESRPSVDTLGVRIEPDREAAGKAQPATPAPTAAGSFPNDFKSTEVPAGEMGPVIKPNSGKPGEFTSFFQSPFAGGQPSEPITPLSQKPSPPRKVIGEFTATFGPPMNWNQEQAPGSGGSGRGALNEGHGEFARSFDLDRTSKAPDNLEPHISTGPSEPAGGTWQTIREPARDSFLAPSVPIPSAPVAPPLPAVPVIESRAPVIERASSSSGATQVFSRPGAKPEITEPEFPSGPGEYTRVFSAPQQPMNANVPISAVSTPAASMPAASLPNFPALVPPPAPPLFHAPALPAPALPAIAKPAFGVPPKPKVDLPETPKPTLSYWPLILTLTVLFFLAALLVVYFALKH